MCLCLWTVRLKSAEEETEKLNNMSDFNTALMRARVAEAGEDTKTSTLVRQVVSWVSNADIVSPLYRDCNYHHTHLLTLEAPVQFVFFNITRWYDQRLNGCNYSLTIKSCIPDI